MEFGCSLSILVWERLMSSKLKTCSWCGKTYESKGGAFAYHCGMKCRSESQAHNKAAGRETTAGTGNGGCSCFQPIAFLILWFVFSMLCFIGLDYIPVKLFDSKNPYPPLVLGFILTVCMFRLFTSR